MPLSATKYHFPIRSWSIELCISCLIILFMCEPSAAIESKESCKNDSAFHDLTSKIIRDCHSTAETALRGFALGFGARLWKFTFIEKEEGLDKLRERLIQASVAGLSVASVILGMSLFVPPQYRTLWFD